MTRFDGRVAVVTGGASGIGAAIARRLASEGARLAVADLDAALAGAVAKEVDGAAVRMDVSSVASVQAGFARVEDELGPVDLLVNNAGVDRFAFFTDTSPEDWDFVLGVNLRGTMACTHAVLAGMQERRRGSIVNIASEAGRTGTVAGASYAAAKAGIIGLTKAIALESVRYGIRCNAVAPGPVETPLLNDAAAAAGTLGAKLKQGMIDATAMGRCGTPDEVAAAVSFLASDEASFMTGQTLAVSGGLSMW
jgi:2-hydroxycyclohexanecarboxyl-CoA dehydrogenase